MLAGALTPLSITPYAASARSESTGVRTQDKACIDQKGDINASLKVLPIFLLSSKMFVVLAGKTYTSRLWCVLEMFTFLRGGGRPRSRGPLPSAVMSLCVLVTPGSRG